MLSRKQALAHERAEITAEAQRALDDASANRRGLTVGELERDDAIGVRLNEISREVSVLDRQASRQSAVSVLNSPDWPKRSHSSGPADPISPSLNEVQEAVQEAVPVGRGRNYASFFPGEQMSCGPFRDHDDFWRSFIQRDRVASERMADFQAAQTTAVDSEGGVALPTTVQAGILDAALETSIVLSRADVIPMTSEKARIYAFDNSSVSGGSLFTNVSAQWVAEGGTATAVTLETKKIELTARKLFLLVEESREIMESGAGFAAELERTLGQAMAWHADNAYLFGDAIGKPQGALTSANPARISASRAGSNLIAAADVLGMAERMHPSLFDESIWITSNPCLDQLAGLHIAGTNSDNFLFAPSQGAGLPNTLLGRPIVLSEKSPNLGTEADLALVSFSGYAIGLRQGIEIDSSQHVGFTRDLVTLRARLRTDGQSKWLSPFQPKDSNSATLSWCVVLAA